jgi:hypothetical protein
VADIICRHFPAFKVDDGLPLRLAAPHLFGCYPAAPFSQAGKLQKVMLPDGEHEVRRLLGRLGELMEEEYGADFLPYRALQQAEQIASSDPRIKTFVFSSVRRLQGEFYRARGAIVIEVRRPGVGPSGNAFDKFETVPDIVIQNSGTLEELEHLVVNIITGVARRGEHLIASK